MPVQVESAISGPFYPNGVTTSFAFAFKADDAAEVIVVDEDGNALSPALYSVALNTGEGGTVTFSVAPVLANYAELYVVGDPAMKQLSDFGNSGPSFNPASLTRAFDRAAIRDLKLKGDTDRSIKVPFGDTGVTLPAVAGRQGKFLAFDAAGLPVVSAGTGADAGLRTDIAAGTGSSLIGYDPGLSDPETQTVQSRLRRMIFATDLDGVVADGTNQNNNLIAGLTANFGASDQVTVVIPSGLRWNPQVVFANAGVQALERLMIWDFGGNNSANKAGENTKVIGVFANDKDETEDTYLASTSGHHAVVMLNNMNTSDTLSAEQAFMSILYARGWFTDGAENDRQFKGAMIAQYRRSNGDTTQWEHVWRSLAPFGALADGVSYTRWAANTAYSVGNYVVTNYDTILVCTVAGTTNSTEPNITSGTVVNGTVTWQYVDVNDRKVFGFDQQGRVSSNGAGNVTDLAAFKQASTDATTIAVLRVSGTGNNREVRWIAEPTSGAGAVVATTYFRFLTSGILEIRDGADNVVAEIEQAKGFKVNLSRAGWNSAANADATPSVLGTATLYVSNTGATSITTLDDGSDGQLVELIATNGNTTLVNSTGFRLTGSTNIALTTGSSVTMRKMPASILSGAWTEVARSIK